MTACDHWDGTTRTWCGREPARLYLPGYRCPDHTPARLAGHDEPGRAAYSLPRMSGLSMATSALNDDRAIASGRRRSNPAAYKNARRNLGKD